MRDPGSKWAPLPEAGEPDGFTKTQLIFHSTGDNASADRIRNYFAQRGVVVESTFIVGKDDSDPTLQIMDSTDNADANYTANQRAIAVEVVNDGVSPWTNWQVAEAIRIGRWAMAYHPIPPRVSPAYDQPGFGWHVMFGAPGPWTTVRGKVCPGKPAINQLKTIIFPAIFAGFDPEEIPLAVGDDILRAIRAQDALLKSMEKRLVHVEKITGDMARREVGDDKAKADALTDLQAKLDNLPPVDVEKLAATLAGLIKKG